ncbi:MAG: 7-carboxy-7-deazaguanine synthase QueE [Candidatus Thiodiazotropha sp. (ex. Lucinisca nassula)]|nr:7-carboxy-7-deazaguanine synthase QueE [Candidatus Thiodiazotropha sp. (ex. Lucinisca nassula)]PUB83991.1 MAG: 7-carboxy-7-deazaguanine synthase QueE [gamma proteobacterium symbiont of Ctena orbiculata]PUB87731.1 MAG: 7-carboxy-7-deazaguanine synthase QueE [gamma proteobacterium symbiont of Ctena orbiculata]
MSQLRITEIFLSLQGEGRSAGYPTVFVRLTGCPLRCRYCDTPYAFSGGEKYTLEEILQQVAGYDVEHVCVTGGEPLAQQECLSLLRALCDADYRVSLETSGAFDIGSVDERVTRVMDLKTPGSGEMQRNRMSNIDFLRADDQLKFVITDRADYEWSCEQLKRFRIMDRCEVLFSPVQDRMNPTQLADWMIEDRVQARLQLQLHKLLWGDQPGR